MQKIMNFVWDSVTLQRWEKVTRRFPFNSSSRKCILKRGKKKIMVEEFLIKTPQTNIQQKKKAAKICPTPNQSKNQP